MSINIDVWSDFACPWCYLASLSLRELADTHPVDVAWRSFELRPAGSPPIPPEYMARIEASKPQLSAIALERFGVTLQQGPFGENTRPALVGAKFAEAQGLGAAYHQAVFSAYWEQGRSIEDRDSLAEIAATVGLEPQAFRAALEDAALQSEVRADVEEAAAYGLTSVPAIVFARRYLVSGAQPTELLREVADRVAAEG